MSVEKGNRNETEAKNILGRVFGSGGVEKVDAYSNHDPFGFVDIVAIKPGAKILFVQVKTNSFTAEHRRKYKLRLHRLPTDHANFEVWVRVDSTGWTMYQYDSESNSFSEYLTMDTCDIEATVEAVREASPYWDK